MAHLIDLSHTVEHGMVTYQGLPAPVMCDFLSREASREHYAPGTEFQIDRIEMVGNTGTYIDCIDTGERPVHTSLLGHDIPMVEHLCGLSQLPDRGSRFLAVPVKVKAFGTFPVRAFAIA